MLVRSPSVSPLLRLQCSASARLTPSAVHLRIPNETTAAETASPIDREVETSLLLKALDGAGDLLRYGLGFLHRAADRLPRIEVGQLRREGEGLQGEVSNALASKHLPDDKLGGLMLRCGNWFLNIRLLAAGRTQGTDAEVFADPRFDDLEEQLMPTPQGEPPGLRTLAGTMREMLGIMREGFAELRADVSVLKTGQAELKTGQAELKTGQDELRKSVGNLETGQAELRTGQDELRKSVGNLETGQAELRTGQDELRESVGNLETGQAELRTGQDELRERVGNLETGQDELRKSVRNLETGQAELKAGQVALGEEVKLEIRHFALRLEGPEGVALEAEARDWMQAVLPRIWPKVPYPPSAGLPARWHPRLTLEADVWHDRLWRDYSLGFPESFQLTGLVDPEEFPVDLLMHGRYQRSDGSEMPFFLLGEAKRTVAPGTDIPKLRDRAAHLRRCTQLPVVPFLFSHWPSDASGIAELSLVHIHQGGKRKWIADPELGIKVARHLGWDPA